MKARKNLILIIASTGVFFEALDIAIVNLAMPLIQNDFQLANDEVQWMQTLYILLYGGFLIIGGRLADTIGRRKNIRDRQRNFPCDVAWRVVGHSIRHARRVQGSAGNRCCVDDAFGAVDHHQYV